MIIKIYHNDGTVSIGEASKFPVLKEFASGALLEVYNEPENQFWTFNWDNVKSYIIEGVKIENE